MKTYGERLGQMLAQCDDQNAILGKDERNIRAGWPNLSSRTVSE
ncbi:MAG TPA: hypothetical protein VL329_04335 [Nitrospiraceae bacterium]|nr:hypothetical protein [Nitrospiraceae bacterium]